MRIKSGNGGFCVTDIKNIAENLEKIGVTPGTLLCGEEIFRLFECELKETFCALFEDIEDISDYYAAAECFRGEVLFHFARRGVRFSAFDGVVISPFAKIGEGTLIKPSTEIDGRSVIGRNCVIGPCSVISESTVGDGCTVNATQIYQSVLEENVKIGPFCHVRPNSRLCGGVKIGDFVEVKNSVVGRDTHASHLTYIGDSDVGEKVNFGCGVVTVNYDGVRKHRTVIGDNAFIGCNTNLVAPVKVGNGAYTAAGSTITKDVPEDALAIERGSQANIEGWAKKRRETYHK